MSTAHRPPTRSRGLAVFVLIFASFMDLIDGTIVNVALPSIRTNLGASPAQLEWVVSAYLLAFAVLLVTGGRLGDSYGRRRIFVIGVVGFTMFSLAAALAPTAALLIAARVAQGAFAALMAPQLVSSIQVLFTAKERAPIFGVVGAVTGLAAVIGPLLGGWLVTANIHDLGWRAVFGINVPIGLLIVVAALFWVPDTTSDRPPRLDLAGVALATLGLFLLTFPLVEGRQQGWPAWIWTMFGAAAVVLAVFVVHQRRRERSIGSSLLPMHLFGNRGFSSGLVTQASFQGAMVGFFLSLTIYVQTGLGFTALHAGVTLVPFSVGAFVGTAVSVPLGAKLGKVVMFGGAVFQAASVLWLLAVVSARGPALSTWDITPALALGGIGLGLLVVPLIDVALATVAPGDAGAASGVYGTVQQVGAAVGVAVIGVVFFGVVGSTYTQPRLADGLTAAGWVAAAGFTICALSTLLLPSRAAVAAHADRHRELVDA